MRDYTKEEINIVFEQLPPAVQEVVVSPETVDFIDQMGEKYTLHIDDQGVFAKQLGLMLMGLRSPEEFSQLLRNKAGLPEETVRSLVREVNEKIFIPLRNKMEESGEVFPKVELPQRDIVTQPIVPVEPKTEKEYSNVFADEPADEEAPSETGEMREPAKPKQVSVEEEPKEKTIEKKYAMDPYREPIDE